jgi:hypothetical protein
MHHRPFAPCRFRALKEASGDIRFTWIRRARVDGDAWGAGEPPIGAEREAYRLEILSGGVAVRVLELAGPTATYHLADQIADFSAPPATLLARVAQTTEGYGPGAFRESTFVL